MSPLWLPEFGVMDPGFVVLIVRTPRCFKTDVGSIDALIIVLSFNFMKRVSGVKVLEHGLFHQNVTSVYCSGRC